MKHLDVVNGQLSQGVNSLRVRGSFLINFQIECQVISRD